VTGNELADHLVSLIEILRRQGDRRVNGLALDVCDGIEIVVPTLESERQRRKRKGGTGVSRSVTPGGQKRVAERDKNGSPSVTQDGSASRLARVGSGSDSEKSHNSKLSSSSKTDSKPVEEEDASVTEHGSRSVTDGSRIPCPEDLELLPPQRATLETALVPGWAIDSFTVTFRAKYAGDEAEARTLGAWRRSLVMTIQKGWNDPAQRPRPPEGATPPRPKPIIETGPRPIECGEVPQEVLDRIGPKRAAPTRPAKSPEEQLEALAEAERERVRAAEAGAATGSNV